MLLRVKTLFGSIVSHGLKAVAIPTAQFTPRAALQYRIESRGNELY